MMSTPTPTRPPLYTALSELLGWTFDRSADIPKSHRFTIAQRLDNRTTDALLAAVRAQFQDPATKRRTLEELNVLLEELRVLWRITHQRRWISQQQLIFVIGRIDEAGRMTGGWLRQLHATPRPSPPKGKGQEG
jgi:hypothetical protein